MSQYNVNKGIGKPVEFKGLKAQYIFYMAGGLMGAFLLFVFMYIVGLDPYFCLATVLVLVTFLFHFVFSVSKKYGQYGLMKLVAKGKRPKFIINRGCRKLSL